MASLYPPYIFGIHDRGGEHLMLQKNKPGWVLVTEAIGADPNNHSGSNYTDLVHKGLKVIVRLNNGYCPAGTIPRSAEYGAFARRCGNFVQASPGCRIWIIGNEPNLAVERPGGPGGEVITPEMYADCFLKCRTEIRRRPGHEADQVVVAAVGPWNVETRYPGNPKGDWIRYFADLLRLLDQAVDGIALHTFTHGTNPNLVFSDATMGAPFERYHYHFRAYRDFMDAIPEKLRNRPVYITETDPIEPWRNENTGWVRNVYQEIHRWNQDPEHQPIQAVILYRWIIGNPHSSQEIGWAIENKPGVQEDLKAAMANEYRVVPPWTKPAYRVAWLKVTVPTRMEVQSTVECSVKMRNDGRITWAHQGSEAVRLSYRWLDAKGKELGGERIPLPESVSDGETITLANVNVKTPPTPGYFTLELDLIKGASMWFASRGSPVWKTQVQVGARYRATWLNVAAPAVGAVGKRTTFPVRVRNDGAFTWPSGGDKPVYLTYRWLDAERKIVVADGLRTPLGRDVPPLGEVSLNAQLQFPPEAGSYLLQLDMVHEFVTWFQWKGSPVHETQVQVQAGAPEYAVEWVSYQGPQRLQVGERGTASLEVKNVGTRSWPWSGDESIRLGYRWLDAQGQEVEVSGIRPTLLTANIEPGQVAVFRQVEFVTPRTPGGYRLVWDLQQGGAWLSTLGAAVLEQPMQIVPAEYAVEWQVLQSWPDELPPGRLQPTGLRLRNLGTRTWSANGDHPVQLAYTWFTADGKLAEPWDTFRIRLPQDVPPGGAVELQPISFQTPSALGDYVLRWDLVEEGVCWFFRQGGMPLEVRLAISDRARPRVWQAQASHNPGEAGLALDGNPTTSWSSRANQEPGMWFQVDLGEVLTLDRVRVSSPGRGFAAGYRIKLSEDGQDWRLVAEKARNWSNIEEAFAPCRARYLRLEQTGKLSWPAAWMITEVAVSVTEPWAGAAASHSAENAAEAFDGRLQSYWSTLGVKQEPGMWFTLDMGTARPIERVTLEHPKNQWPRGYVVRVSADGQTWQEVGRKNSNGDRVDVRFTSRSARYVRIETTRASNEAPWGIAEIVVWRSAPVWIYGRGSA